MLNVSSEAESFVASLLRRHGTDALDDILAQLRGTKESTDMTNFVVRGDRRPVSPAEQYSRDFRKKYGTAQQLYENNLVHTFMRANGISSLQLKPAAEAALVMALDASNTDLRKMQNAQGAPYNGKLGQSRPPSKTPTPAGVGTDDEESDPHSDLKAILKKHLNPQVYDACEKMLDGGGAEQDETTEDDELPDNHSPDDNDTPPQWMQGAKKGMEGDPEEALDDPQSFPGRPKTGGSMDRVRHGGRAYDSALSKVYVGFTKSQEDQIKKSRRPKRIAKQIAMDAKKIASKPDMSADFFEKFPQAARIRFV
jgi:hypothetical protein